MVNAPHCNASAPPLQRFGTPVEGAHLQRPCTHWTLDVGVGSPRTGLPGSGTHLLFARAKGGGYHKRLFCRRRRRECMGRTARRGGGNIENTDKSVFGDVESDGDRMLVGSMQGRKEYWCHVHASQSLIHLVVHELIKATPPTGTLACWERTARSMLTAAESPLFARYRDGRKRPVDASQCRAR